MRVLWPLKKRGHRSDSRNTDPRRAEPGVRGVLSIRGMMSLRCRSSIASESDCTSKPFILSGLNTYIHTDASCIHTVSIRKSVSKLQLTLCHGPTTKKCLTLWCPLLQCDYVLNHPVSDRVKPSFVIYDIRALWHSALSARVPGCQKLQMTA